jgi:V8-like Glu-specific endopeptidase
MNFFTRLLATAFLITLLGLASLTSCGNATIPGILQLTDASGSGFCTTFSVNDQQRMFVTAAHCVDEADPDLPQPYLFGHKIVVKKFDRQVDLAVFQAVLGQQQLKVAQTMLLPSDRTSVYGFVRDHQFPTTYRGTFSNHALYFNRERQQLILIALFDMEIDSGQSGSPVMNAEGEVVSVAQLWFFTEKMGGGPPQVVFYEFVKEFLPQPID